MSSSVALTWQLRAERARAERERQACLELRAELAELAQRHRSLRRRQEAACAAHGWALGEIPGMPGTRAGASSAELRQAVAEARAGLVRAAHAVDEAITKAKERRASQSAASRSWTALAGPAGAVAPAPAAAPSIDLANLGAGGQAGAFRTASGTAGSGTEDLAAEADSLIEECQVRCLGRDLSGLLRLRAGLGAGPAADQAAVEGIRYRAAMLIQDVKRESALEERRAHLQVLTGAALPQERAALRQQVAGASGAELQLVEREVRAAVERAAAERTRSEAVAALDASLRELGYTVGEAFQSLLPVAGPGRQHQSRITVVPSRHSAEHGLRVRVDEDQIYLSVIRRAGTGIGGGPAGSTARPAASPEEARLAADVTVQERTCQDLVAVVSAAAVDGVEITLGNVRTPGRPAPEMPAAYWSDVDDRSREQQSGDDQSQPAADVASGELARRWAERERTRQATMRRAQQNRPRP